MQTLSQSTVDLIANITRPLISSGAIHKSEQTALVQILKSHATGNSDQSTPIDSRKFITPAEAAKLFSMSKRTIMRMIEAGELEAQYLRPGSRKTLRIKLASIDALSTAAAEVMQ